MTLTILLILALYSSIGHSIHLLHAERSTANAWRQRYQAERQYGQTTINRESAVYSNRFSQEFGRFPMPEIDMPEQFRAMWAWPDFKAEKP